MADMQMQVFFLGAKFQLYFEIWSPNNHHWYDFLVEILQNIKSI